jgi:phosphatidylglycerol:prolipoprotein diacylglycerol transferase
MHPILFYVPVPAWRVPVAALGAVAALVSLVIVLVGARLRRRDFVAVAAVSACLALYVSFSRRGMVLVWGALPVQAWGFFFGLALLLGGALTLRRTGHAGIERSTALPAILLGLVFGLIGARVAYGLGHFQPRAAGSMFGGEGLSGLEIGGALPCAMLGASLSFGRDRSLLSFLDAAAPALGVGVFLTRIGCYLEGCDFGVPLRDGASPRLSALGTFPAQSPPWVTHVLERGLSPSATTSLPVHPTELYEALGGLAIAALAYWVEKKKRPVPGQVALVALVAFVAVRLGVDFFRDDRVHVVTFRVALLALPLVALFLHRRMATVTLTPR